MKKIKDKPQKRTLKEVLKDIIPHDKLEKVNRSFEIVGDIAICEIAEELKEYDEKIGNAIMKTNKSIKVVLKKSGIHHGEFRTQDLVHIAGEDRKETIYLENAVRLKINPETVYFSARLSTERGELMDTLEEGKRVLVMFSGIGPYSFTAVRKQPNLSRVTSIEINPEGHKYALINRDLNKNVAKKSKFYKSIIEFLRNNNMPIYEKLLVSIFNELKLHFINGDVREEVEKLKLVEYSKSVDVFQNELFKQNPKDIFSFLKQAEFNQVFLDLDSINIDINLVGLIFIFTQKFDFVCRINGVNYDFSDLISKGYLINYLERRLNDNSQNSILDINLFDEIYMPLPKDAELFLDCAFKVAEKGCIIHMYDFVHENEFPHKSEDAVLKASEVAGRKVKVIGTRKVGQYSPRKYRVCCDFLVLD